MKYPIIKYNQGNKELITTVLPFEVIKNNSKVLVYGIDTGGYQRAPEYDHYKKITKYIKTSDSVMFPTSIVLGIDEDKVNALLKEENTKILLDSEVKTPLFRIIDGQHRLKGIEDAVEGNPKLNNFMLNVVILATPAAARSTEMEVFHTINSTSKRISIDLIRLAKYDYDILENSVNGSNLVDHICTAIAYLVNENRESKWYNAIKLGIHNDEKIGIIGVDAFMKSIKRIVSNYLDPDRRYKELKDEELIKFANNSAKEISILINQAWDVVSKKWSDCFKENSDFNHDSELKTFYYKSDYYMQKTLGASSINNILGDIIKENGYHENCLRIFSEVIQNSSLFNKDWKVGETFRGYSSESGFNKIKKIITQ